MIIRTTDINSLRPFIKKLRLPNRNSHKGQNGRLLIIGGSKLFHAATLWPAAVASRFVDMVHYSSTKENEKIFVKLKTKFVDGIVIEKKHLEDYVREDDCILVGPGMVRGPVQKGKSIIKKISDTFTLVDEPTFTHYLVKMLLTSYPDKKFVLDGGAIQMMNASWLKKMSERTIITPHAGEFTKLFGIAVKKMTKEKLKQVVCQAALSSSSVILLKTVCDIISDGHTTVEIEGGNAGLTKGGTGDTLAGLTAALNTKNDQMTASIVASFTIKKAAEDLYKRSRFWYNTSDLVQTIPTTLAKLII